MMVSNPVRFFSGGTSEGSREATVAEAAGAGG
jgi:hypothetical protein